MVSRIFASIIGSEGDIALEIIVETVLDGRADGRAGAGPEGLESLGQHMGKIVVDQLQRAGVIARQKLGYCTIGQGGRAVCQFSIDKRGYSGFGKAEADAGGQIDGCAGRGKRACGPIGQADMDHGVDFRGVIGGTGS